MFLDNMWVSYWKTEAVEMVEEWEACKGCTNKDVCSTDKHIVNPVLYTTKSATCRALRKEMEVELKKKDEELEMVKKYARSDMCGRCGSMSCENCTIAAGR
jgi:hypothetical protein